MVQRVNTSRLAKGIKAACEAKGVTPHAVAQSAKINVANFLSALRGERSISISDLERISSLIDVPLNRLQAWKDQDLIGLERAEEVAVDLTEEAGPVFAYVCVLKGEDEHVAGRKYVTYPKGKETAVAVFDNPKDLKAFATRYPVPPFHLAKREIREANVEAYIEEFQSLNINWFVRNPPLGGIPANFFPIVDLRLLWGGDET